MCVCRKQYILNYFTLQFSLYFWANICSLSEHRRVLSKTKNRTDYKLLNGNVGHIIIMISALISRARDICRAIILHSASRCRASAHETSCRCQVSCLERMCIIASGLKDTSPNNRLNLDNLHSNLLLWLINLNFDTWWSSPLWSGHLSEHQLAWQLHLHYKKKRDHAVCWNEKIYTIPSDIIRAE